ncbi:hypothetical protein FHS38_005784 [Streptomyces netropsis]|uniref:Uncharacterized protein n=1 Tax=Streptomyces netropsis TaxID=55404 RepID=A0A7W7LHC4_STRNE|nr:hypothetical protein [Streptomyces netropsis]
MCPEADAVTAHDHPGGTRPRAAVFDVDGILDATSADDVESAAGSTTARSAGFGEPPRPAHG